MAVLGLAGPRVSELCNARWRDFYASEAVLHIPTSKTSAGERDIELHRVVLRALEQHRERSSGCSEDLIWPTAAGPQRDRTAWFRFARPLVGDEKPSALQCLAAAGDFGAGLSGTLPRDDYLFINPDLTLHVEREPVGEWICLGSQTRISADGIGVAESVLYDERSRVGRATQALLIAPALRPVGM